MSRRPSRNLATPCDDCELEALPEEIKELLEYPIDEELYLDVLLILARTGEQFALNELKALFDSHDYIRAREIAEVFWQTDRASLDALQDSIKKSPDWLLKEYLLSEKKDKDGE